MVGQEDGERGSFLVGLSTQVPFVVGFQAGSQGGLTTPPVPGLPRWVGMGLGHWTWGKERQENHVDQGWACASVVQGLFSFLYPCSHAAVLYLPEGKLCRNASRGE